MARIASVFGSLPPLIPAPVAPPDTMTIPDGPLARIPQAASPRVIYEPPGDFSDAPTLPKINLPSKAPQMLAHVPQANVQLTSDPLQRIEGHAQNKLEADERKDAYKPTTFGEKLAHALSKIGNVAGDIVAPNVMARIPGTDLNREVDESNQANAIKTAEDAEAENAQKASLAKEEEAQARSLENPPSTPLPTAAGYVSFNPRTNATSPIEGANGQPLMPYVKPGPRQHVFLQGGDGKPVAATFDPQSGTYYDAHDQPIQNPQPYEKPTTPQHITVMHNGQPHVMGADAQGNFTRDLGVAPPNYGAEVLPTKTATFIGADGVPREYQWNPTTQTYDKPLGTSASNAYGHEAAQAGAVERAGAQLIASLEANKQRLGTLGAWVQKYGLDTPIADPTLQGIQAQLASFAALNPAMHGARGTEAMKHFEHLIGGLQQNPDATIAGIRAIMQTASAINPDSQPAAQSGNGKTFDSAKWAKANPNGDINAAKAYAKSQGYEVK